MRYGLIGEKLGHSFSKEIHEMLGNKEYEIVEIPKDKLDEFMTKKDFIGINVTIPYKERVIPHLDYISEEAKSIGAVNTIVNVDGKLYGYNTDFFGLKDLILSQNMSLTGRKVLILGTGGTSKTAECVCKSLGASKVLKVSRTVQEGVYTYDQKDKFKDAEYIINTTPVGMYPDIDSLPIDPGLFLKLRGVVDVIYNPLKTRLVIRSSKLGVSACNGLYMLVSQAVKSSELFMGKTYPYGTTQKLYSAVYMDKLNIVLTGMPGSGKTTIGKVVAKRLNKDFIDLDEYFEEKYNVSAGDYIKKYGETQFREAESVVVAETSARTGCVIATGGGAVLRAENVEKMRINGRIYFLNRSLEKLQPTSDRPLSSSYESLKMRYDERIAIYRSTADRIIPDDGTVEETADRICQQAK